MKLQLAICATVLGLAACSPAPTEEAGGANAKRMPLPECAAVEAEDAGAEGWKHPDCRMILPDQSGMAIEARYTPAEDDSTKVTVQVVAAGDATLQTIEERMGNTFNGPTLEDVDKDGMVDILIPLETGNVNTTWAFWKQTSEGKFARVGEPSGVEIEKTESGYLAVQGRSSAAEYYVTFYKLLGEELQQGVTARVEVRGEADKVTGVECSIEEDEELLASGMTADSAKAQFCAEAPVLALIKDMAPVPDAASPPVPRTP
jgi:hypothetical protein